MPDPGADSEGVSEVGPTEEGTGVPVTGIVTGTVVPVSPGAVEVAECGWQTSSVQVTVWVTVMLLVPVVIEVIVLEPEVIVVVPTGQVVVTKVMVLVVTGVLAGPEGAMVVGPTELGTGVPEPVTTGIEDPTLVAPTLVGTEEDPPGTPVTEPVVHGVVLGP